ncbi:MAG TPA: hypothetical protein VHE13_01400 [Opitutus sp.]|nr:hypothetical protein [Opitutus sp.]
MFLRGPVLCLSLALTASADAAGPAPNRYNRVEIAPTKTSVYVGTVAMTMPPFVRRGESYESTYTAKVFPFFFLGEQGRLAVTIPDAALDQLVRGEPLDFDGRATSESGDDRRLTGHAVPTDASSGKLTVRVFVSKRIQLIFHTTYRFSVR